MVGRRRVGKFYCRLLATAWAGIAATSAFSQTMDATRMATGLELPVFTTAAPGDSDRLFIVEQRTGGNSTTGRIQILDLNSGLVNATPFLEVPGMDKVSEEQGLLGMAFHPDYENNGYFYLTESYNGHTDIVRYQVSGDDDIAISTGTTILTYSQPHPCHNGNWIGFGPDGMLYHTSGDGGSQHDGFENSQNKTTLNGSVVRIDVGADGLADDFPADPNRNYAIPASNPFVGEGGGVREELWSIGLRNPWRASFDSLTGDFYIGDTSQDTLELINFQHAGAPGGQNYGWPLREGTIETPSGGVGGPKPPGAIDPIYEYMHSHLSGTIGSATGTADNKGNSVTGGYVYRGPENALNNEYFFADFVHSRIWSFEFDGTADPLSFSGQNHNSSYKSWTITPDAGSMQYFSSFGEDADGNLYVLNYLSGELFRLDPDYFDADFELDGDVDDGDFDEWEGAFGSSTYGDADGDADTDGYDFLTWQRQFGSQKPPPPVAGPANWTSGVSGSWSTASQWSDGVGPDPQTATTTFGSNYGWDSTGPFSNGNIIIDGTAGTTDVLFDSDAVVSDFIMNSNGAAEGSLTISGGATFEIRSTTTNDGRWSQFDNALLKVTGAGSVLSRTHTNPAKNGGAMIFGSWRSEAGQEIKLEVLDQATLDNQGQMWFGAYNSSEKDLVVTWEVGAGASINNHDALGGGVSLDNTAGAQGEINFIWNYDSGSVAMDDSTYTIDISGQGGSITVGEEGIRYQQETSNNVWSTTLKTYEQLWNDGRLTASTSLPGGVFGDYFAVVGSSGSAGYQVTNIQAAPAFPADITDGFAGALQASHTGDINGDLTVNSLDIGILFANFGTGTTVSQGDINMFAPGDDIIDAADAGIMFASYTGDPSPASLGTASAVYDPATGQIVVTVDGVNNWYIESVSSSLTADARPGSLVPGSLVTDNDTRIGETTIALFSYADQNLGNVAAAGLPFGDLWIYSNAGLGQTLEKQQVGYLGAAGIVEIPEPNTIVLFGLAFVAAGFFRKR